MYSTENPTQPQLLEELKTSSNFQDAFNTHILKEATSVAIKKLKENISNSNPRGLKLLSPNKLMTFVETFSKKNSKSTELVDTKLLEEIIDLYTSTGIPVYSTYTTLYSRIIY